MQFKHLIFFTTLINSHLLSAPQSIDKFINELSEEQGEITKMIDLSMNRSCILRILQNSISKCNQDSNQFDRRSIAIDLTKCLFEPNGKMPTLPQECITLTDIDACIGKIATDGVLWTTFFGYTNLVESFCSYYSNDLTTLRVMEDYEIILANLKDLIIRYNHNMDVNIDETTDKMSEMVAMFQRKFEEMANETMIQLDKFQKANSDVFKTHWIELDAHIQLMMKNANVAQQKVVNDVSENLVSLAKDQHKMNLGNLNAMSTKMDSIIADKTVLMGGISFTEIAVQTLVIVASLASGRPILFVIGLVIGVHLGF